MMDRCTIMKGVRFTRTATTSWPPLHEHNPNFTLWNTKDVILWRLLVNCFGSHWFA